MLTLSTLEPLYPAYNQELIFTAHESSATNNYTYQIDVYMNNASFDSFFVFANPTLFSATINLSTILQLYFTSSVYVSTGNTINEVVPNSIVPYYVNITCRNVTGGTVSTGTTGTHYTFNGCTNPDDNFTMSQFVMQSGLTGNFLTNYSAPRGITINDYAYVSVINGHYTNGFNIYNSVYAGVTITRYQTDGSTSAITETF
jgi:hypothetical protein